MSTEQQPADSPWGLYDSVERCWIGNEAGPLLYTDTEIKGTPLTGRQMASLAAYLVNERCCYVIRRVYARRYDEIANKIKDKITPPLSTAEAMERLGL